MTDNMTDNMSTDIATTASGFSEGLEFYSTFSSESFEDKVRIAEAVSNAEPLSDHIGEEIAVKDFICHYVKLENQEGTEVEALRTVISDGEGHFYSTVSNGIVSALQNLVRFLGDPKGWPEPVRVVPAEERTRKGFKVLTLHIA